MTGRMGSMTMGPGMNDLIRQIRDDKTHGASELARQALNVFKLAAEKSQATSANQFRLEMDKIAEKLISARPSMAPVSNAVHLLLTTLRENDNNEIGSLRTFIIARADELIRLSIQATTRIAGHTAGLITDKDIIFTHSYSSTIMAALKAQLEKA